MKCSAQCNATWCDRVCVCVLYCLIYICIYRGTVDDLARQKQSGIRDADAWCVIESVRCFRLFSCCVTWRRRRVCRYLMIFVPSEVEHVESCWALGKWTVTLVGESPKFGHHISPILSWGESTSQWPVTPQGLQIRPAGWLLVLRYWRVTTSSWIPRKIMENPNGSMDRLAENHFPLAKGQGKKMALCPCLGARLLSNIKTLRPGSLIENKVALWLKQGSKLEVFKANYYYMIYIYIYAYMHVYCVDVYIYIHRYW